MANYSTVKQPHSGQKFISLKRAPRVQIEYDVEIYGADRKVQLPFVMGVMADLSGQSSKNQPEIAERKFLEFDITNFDERMKSYEPRLMYHVDNTLNGEGKLGVDLTFTGIDDFLPDAIVRNIEPLNELLRARTELSNLLSYMDGKNGAEALIASLLKNPALLHSLAVSSKTVIASDNHIEMENSNE